MAMQASSASNTNIALWHEIETTIARSYHYGSPLPVSMNELVAMAIISRARAQPILVNKDLIDRSIFSWLSQHVVTLQSHNNFPCYSHNVYKCKCEPMDFEDVYSKYEIPLSGKDPRNTGAVDGGSSAFTIPLREGRVFLSSILEAPRKGVFHFLALPLEMRLRIYEMLFSHPTIMVGLPTTERIPVATTLCVRKREHQIEYDCGDRGAFIRTQPLSHILAILSTNKQIYEEAVPVFYQINRFMANSLNHLTAWVRSIAPSRLQHVRHLAFRYVPLGDVAAVPRSRWKEALHAISNLQRVKELRIDLTDRQWFGSGDSPPPTQYQLPAYSDPCQLPGMVDLVKIVRVAESLTITGDCPRIKAHLLSVSDEDEAMILNSD